MKGDEHGPGAGRRTSRRHGHREHRPGSAEPGVARGAGRSWVITFVLRLLAGWAVAIGVLALAPGVEQWAVTSTVDSVAVALRLASLQPDVFGTTIQIGRAALNIIPECTPVMPVLLLAIAMVSYPATARWRLAGIGVGIVTLWLFNVVRMLALLATMQWWPGSFKFMHVYLWQTITLLVVCGLFLTWLRLTPPARARVRA